MVSFRHLRAVVAQLPLVPNWNQTEQERRRYDAWARMSWRLGVIDRVTHALRMLVVKRYNREIEAINADDVPQIERLDDAPLWTRASYGPARISNHFEHERWRRS